MKKSLAEIFAENLRHARTSRSMTVEKLAELVGVSQPTVTDWENKKKQPRAGVVERLAEIFNADISYFFTDQNKESVIPSNIIPARTVMVPILGTIACGEPIYIAENFRGYREELSDHMPKGNVFLLEAKGDSMEPTVPDGAYVLVREQPEVEYGEIAAVIVNGDTEATLKRVRRQGDMIYLVSENPKYPPYIITADNPARILGKALRVTKDL